MFKPTPLPPVEDQREVVPYDKTISMRKGKQQALISLGALVLGAAVGALLDALANTAILQTLLTSEGSPAWLVLMIPLIHGLIAMARDWHKRRFGVYSDRRNPDLEGDGPLAAPQTSTREKGEVDGQDDRWRKVGRRGLPPENDQQF